MIKEYRRINFRYFPYGIVFMSWVVIIFILLYWIKKKDINVINTSIFFICTLIIITRKGIELSNHEFSKYVEFLFKRFYYEKVLISNVKTIFFDKLHGHTMARSTLYYSRDYISVINFLYILSVSDEFNEERVLFKSIKFDSVKKVAQLLSEITGLDIRERYIKKTYPRKGNRKTKVIVREAKIYEGETDEEKNFLKEERKRRKKKLFLRRTEAQKIKKRKSH
jgi:hypothetical protein